MQIDGKLFGEMCVSAANALENNKTAINHLNVFPVPDGDTGVNMSLTMSAVRELEGFGGTAAECAARVADLILRAARGNSGAILSLFFRGFAKSLAGVERADAADVAEAFAFGTKEAYSAVMNPSEGTILTVMRICAERATEATRAGRFAGDMRGLFAYLLETAGETLAKTPELLPILKESGVVDAGGSGFVTVISGMLAALDGNPVTAAEPVGTSEEHDAAAAARTEIRYTYCTEWILEKDAAHTGEGSAAALRDLLAGKGDSVVYIEDEKLLKVHVHTDHPGELLEAALAYGSLSKVKIENMRDQHSELIREEPLRPVGFVAVAAGAGVAAAFRDLGANGIVEGGRTMNPSTDDLVSAVRGARAETVFLFPNNKNIFLVADQAAEIVAKEGKTRVVVIPTTQFTEGLSAMMAFDPEADAETNRVAMLGAKEAVHTLSFTHAVRDADVEGIHIRDGEVLALLDGKVTAAAPDFEGALDCLLPQAANASFLTLWTGEEADATLAGVFAQKLRAAAPRAEVLSLSGGQPLYDFVVSAE